MVGGAPPVAGQVLAAGHHPGVGLPQIGVAPGAAVLAGQTAPQPTGGAPATAAQRVGHDLPGAAEQSQPEPHFALFAAHKRAQLVQFQPVTGSWWGQRLAQRRQLLGFFLTNSSRSGATRQRCVSSPASWCVPGRRAGFPPCAPRHRRWCPARAGWCVGNPGRNSVACRCGPSRVCATSLSCSAGRCPSPLIRLTPHLGHYQSVMVSLW